MSALPGTKCANVMEDPCNFNANTGLGHNVTVASLRDHPLPSGLSEHTILAEHSISLADKAECKFFALRALSREAGVEIRTAGRLSEEWPMHHKLTQTSERRGGEQQSTSPSSISKYAPPLSRTKRANVKILVIPQTERVSF